MAIEKILGVLPDEQGIGPIEAQRFLDALDTLAEVDVEADSILAMWAFTPATMKEVAEQHHVGLTHVKTKVAIARRILRRELGIDE